VKYSQSNLGQDLKGTDGKGPNQLIVTSRDVEAAISSTASAFTPIASASNRTWTLREPGLNLIFFELADKHQHDYQNQQLTIYNGTF